MKSSFQIGDRIEACQLISWTLDEYEDHPLIVQQGDRGLICQITNEVIYIDWDKDQFKRIPRCINLLYFNEKNPSIRVVDK
jgi:hypothetical protein